ncbi:MAG: YccS family putative transporter [Ancalomicrobiaceae bacterium]|nr:YccS family putative transporter [Ancalomicrobiaceae bacterium]
MDTFPFSLRVFVALAGAMGACSVLGAIDRVIPLFLGVIAGAIAETDDGWRGRAKTVAITLALFATSAVFVELLTPYPGLFFTALVASTFTLTMMGALRSHYTTIAQATLILGVYTMLSLEQAGPSPVFLREPILLTVGAAWYGALSVLWQAAFPVQPVEQGLAGLFDELGEYLKSKSTLFVPRRQLNIDGAKMVLAGNNGRVVIALNRVKELIRRRVRFGRENARLERCLNLFFSAQDIHERASSSHYPYDAFSQTFFHSDVMFRCQRLMWQQGLACRELARALRRGEIFSYGESRQAADDLQDAFDYLKAQNRPEHTDVLPSLGDLVENLEALEHELIAASVPTDASLHHDTSLFDDTPHSLGEAWRRVAAQLSPDSAVFRHALRLTLALGVGYGIKSAVHPTQGYWILLTTLFVCQPNYASTRRRLWERIFGTILGLVAGWALLTLFPALEIQRLIAVVAGVAFFIYRTSRYTLATGAITLMVVCCSNQVVDGYGIIWPRLEDTVIGSLLAGLAVFFVMPDWQGRQIHKVVAGTLSGASGYLRAIIRQYGSGKSDDLDYRIARRIAHEADAALSSTLSNMLQEPGRYRAEAESRMRQLVVSHTILSYLSALGAHRGALQELSVDGVLGQAALRIARSLDDIATDLIARRPVAETSGTEAEDERMLEDLSGEIDDRERFVRTQLALICRQLRPMRKFARELQDGFPSNPDRDGTAKPEESSPGAR